MLSASCALCELYFYRSVNSIHSCDILYEYSSASIDMQRRSREIREQRRACGARDSALRSRNVHCRSRVSALVVCPLLLSRLVGRSLPSAPLRANSCRLQTSLPRLLYLLSSSTLFTCSLVTRRHIESHRLQWPLQQSVLYSDGHSLQSLGARTSLCTFSSQ